MQTKKLLFMGALCALLLPSYLNSASAQAQTTTTVYERGIKTAWSELDLTDWSTPTTGTLSISDGLKYSVAKSTSKSVSTKAITLTQTTSIVNFKATWNVGYGTGKTGVYSILGLGDLQFIWYGQAMQAQIKYGDQTASLSALNTKLNRGATWTIDATINQATGNVDYTVSTTASSDIASGSFTYRGGSYSTLTFGQGGSSYWDDATTLSKVEITETTQAVTTADYTVKYMCGETALKDPATYSGVVGDAPTLSASDLTTITKDGVRYIYESNDAADKTINEDGSTVVTLNFHKARTATLNVTYTVGDNSSTVTTNLEEGDDQSLAWSYTYPLYKEGTDGKYYKADNTDSFGESGTFSDGETINKTVSYSTADDDVVFFGEAEGDNAGTNTSYSNGATGYVASQNVLTRGISLGTLEPGEYSATVMVTERPDRKVVIRDVNGATDDTNNLATTDGTSTGTQTLTFTLTSAKSLIINGKYTSGTKSNQSATFDYIVVKKTGDATTTVNINETSKLASYSNASTVTVPEDVVVYIATATNGNTITLNKVNSQVIPAGQGVILYSATTGDKTVTYSGTADESLYTGNLLKATADTAFTSTGSEYALVKGEQSFAQVTSGVEIPANKAYLVISSGAKNMSLDFGQVDAIKSINAENTTANGELYNIAGQRVNKNYRGIVIVNGKKYINK